MKNFKHNYSCLYSFDKASFENNSDSPTRNNAFELEETDSWQNMGVQSHDQEFSFKADVLDKPEFEKSCSTLGSCFKNGLRSNRAYLLRNAMLLSPLKTNDLETVSVGLELSIKDDSFDSLSRFFVFPS